MAENLKSTLLDADDLRPIIKFVSKNWYLMVLIPAIFFAFAYFYTHKMADIYAAKSEILLKSGETYEYQSQIYKEVGYYAAYNDITNQKRILSSYDLLSKALDKLDFTVSYYIVGRIKTGQVDRLDAFSVWADYKSFHKNLLNHPFDVKILDINNYQLSYDFNGNLISSQHAFGDTIDGVNFVLKIDRNKFLTEETFESIKRTDFQFRVHHHESLVKRYQSQLTIEQVEYTSILALSVQDELPNRAKTFLDTLSNEYIMYSLESQINVNENTQLYIAKQLNELDLIIDSLEQDMEDYKARKGILDLPREQSEYFTELFNLEKEKKQIQYRLESAIAIEDYVRNGYEEKLLPPAIFVFQDDEFLKSTLNKLYDLHLHRQTNLLNYKPENVIIKKEDSLITSISQNILQYLNNTKKALKGRISDLNVDIRFYEDEVKRLPKSIRDILGIERKLKVNESLFVFLLEKKANTVIARAAIIPQTSVIEKARTLGVVGPNRQSTHYTAIGLGLFVALIIGVIRLLFFERIESLRELRALATIPVIGSVPNHPSAESDPLVVDIAPKSNVAEAFRSLRTNLQYLLPGEKTKIILVTSLHPGEGKTFTSANLAAIFAKANKRVLLMDFDMHKPKVHKNFGVENISGVSTLLIGKAELADCIIPTQVENLDIVTAGPVPPNASELVLSDKVQMLLEEAAESYDFLFIDTPPLMLISDSLVLLKLADTGVFVLNTEKATKQGVRHLEEILGLNKLSHNCLLLNNVKHQRWRYYYGKYAYKYGYGYGYGYAYGSGYGYGYGYGYGEDPENSGYGDTGEKKRRIKPRNGAGA